jgi:hypothetical protein
MPRTTSFAVPFVAVFISVLALALVAAPSPAAAQTSLRASGWQAAPLLVAQKKRPRRYDGRIIACRPRGCFRIPYGCHTEVEYDWWGNPTGYDKIVCPGR